MDKFRRIAAHFGTEFVDVATVQFTPSLLRCIPRELARKYRVLPIAESDRRITIAISDPADLSALDGLSSALDREIELCVCVADESQIDSFIQRFYGDEN
jgi:type II secretory ATPase GspE/PulE/Tfp pilus assembly ATPase PilB-like protein